jgi:hypothetical protein
MFRFDDIVDDEVGCELVEVDVLAILVFELLAARGALRLTAGSGPMTAICADGSAITASESKAGPAIA